MSPQPKKKFFTMVDRVVGHATALPFEQSLNTIRRNPDPSSQVLDCNSLGAHRYIVHRPPAVVNHLLQLVNPCCHRLLLTASLRIMTKAYPPAQAAKCHMRQKQAGSKAVLLYPIGQNAALRHARGVTAKGGGARGCRRRIQKKNTAKKRAHHHHHRLTMRKDSKRFENG